MKLLTKALFAATAAVALSTTALADGMSIGGFVGASLMPKAEFGANKESLKTGYDLGVNLGYRSGPLSYVGEFAYFRNKYKDAPVHRYAYALMGNVLYHFDNVDSNFEPYAGVGIGLIHLKDKSATITTPDGNRTAEDSLNAFGYQGILGVAYKINNATSLTLDYHYIASLKKDVDLKVNGVSQGKFKTKFEDHTINLGLVYKFS